MPTRWHCTSDSSWTRLTQRLGLDFAVCCNIIVLLSRSASTFKLYCRCFRVQASIVLTCHWCPVLSQRNPPGSNFQLADLCRCSYSCVRFTICRSHPDAAGKCDSFLSHIDGYCHLLYSTSSHAAISVARIIFLSLSLS
eukprot:scpid8755/ scgid32083/ 